MISVNKEKEIRRLLLSGMPQEKIAGKLKVTRHQVRKVKEALERNDSKNPLAVSTTNPAQLALTSMREQIMQWYLHEGYSYFIIHKKLSDTGVIVSKSSVQRYIGSFKKSEVYVPVHTAPGEEAQVDYGYLGRFFRNGKQIKVWVFCMVLSHSRYAYYCLATEQSAEAFVDAHTKAFEFFGGCPKYVKIDNLGAGVMEADYYQAEFQEFYKGFLDHYGVSVVNARPNRGQDKGKVEAGVKYVKLNFPYVLNGERDFDEAASRLAKWNGDLCNKRLHGTTRKIPVKVFTQEESSQLLPLPERRFQLVRTEQRKVDSYGHIYYRYNFYSVPFHYSGETLKVEVANGLLQIFKGNSIVTTHLVDPGQGNFITRDSHKSYHKQIRSDPYYLEEMTKIGESAVRLFDVLKAAKPFHWKNMVKGVLQLQKAFKKHQIETACREAMVNGTVDYKSVRMICIKNDKEKLNKEAGSTPKNTNGYHRDLSIYDRLYNKPL